MSCSYSLGGFLGFLSDLGGNSVHVFGSLLGKSLANNLAVLDGHLSNETSGLELLEAISDVLTSSLGGMLGACSITLSSRVVLSEGVDSNSSSNVKLICN